MIKYIALAIILLTIASAEIVTSEIDLIEGRSDPNENLNPGYDSAALKQFVFYLKNLQEYIK